MTTMTVTTPTGELVFDMSDLDDITFTGFSSSQGKIRYPRRAKFAENAEAGKRFVFEAHIPGCGWVRTTTVPKRVLAS